MDLERHLMTSSDNSFVAYGFSVWQSFSISLYALLSAIAIYGYNNIEVLELLLRLVHRLSLYTGHPRRIIYFKLMYSMSAS